MNDWPLGRIMPDWQDQDVSRSRPITTAEAATIADMKPEAFRKAMLRERTRDGGYDFRLPKDQWFPGENPAWDERAIRGWAAGRSARADTKEQQ